MLAALLLAAALAGCTSLIAGAPSAIFDLTAPGDAAGTQGSAQVLVPEPTTVRALDTDRIAARPTPSEYAYLPGAVWSDRLPKLLQTRLVQTLQNSGRAARRRGAGAGAPDRLSSSCSTCAPSSYTQRAPSPTSSSR